MTLLVTTGFDSAQISAATEARSKAAMLQAEAKEVTTIADRLDFDSATFVLKNLKAFASEVEDQRTKAKAPILNLGKKIDALAKELTGTIASEQTRIARLCGAFELAEREKALEARQKADAEAARIAHEAQLQAAKVRVGVTDAEQADRASDQVIAEAQSKIVELKQTAIESVAVKTEGAMLRKDTLFEVTDIVALYKAHPELVTLEPNGQAIRAICKQNPNLQIPGLRHWQEAKLSV